MNGKFASVLHLSGALRSLLMSGLELSSRTTVNLVPRRSVDQLQMCNISALCWFEGVNLWIKTESGL